MSNEIVLYPNLDEPSLLFFKTALLNNNCYLEYGCGGSTTYAIRETKIKTIISVDTSLEWINNINEYLKNSETDSETQLFLTHCNLGVVERWGTPVNRNNSIDFWKYMVAPWKIVKENRLSPDIILIDGRFRVACFLYSVLCADYGTTIMIDDYFHRPHYHIVERFCKLKERHGRMGVFYVEHNYSIPEIVAYIAKYSTNWD
jgi:hypothetical protein